jgi:hypothetical protein
VDRLRSLTEKALAVLEASLDGADRFSRWKTAVEVLKLARLPGAEGGIGDQDAESIVRKKVEAERKNARGELDDLLDEDKYLPGFDDHMMRTWEALEAQANGDGADSSPG